MVDVQYVIYHTIKWQWNNTPVLLMYTLVIISMEVNTLHGTTYIGKLQDDDNQTKHKVSGPSWIQRLQMTTDERNSKSTADWYYVLVSNLPLLNMHSALLLIRSSLYCTLYRHTITNDNTCNIPYAHTM